MRLEGFSIYDTHIEHCKSTYASVECWFRNKRKRAGADYTMERYLMVADDSICTIYRVRHNRCSWARYTTNQTFHSIQRSGMIGAALSHGPYIYHPFSFGV